VRHEYAEYRRQAVLGTTHNAVADYRADEQRYIERCQVMATRFYGPEGTAWPRRFAART